jgi:Hemolysin coregulated protein Hcp (TssD)
MSSLYAEIQVAGQCAALRRGTYALYQPVDEQGRPNSTVHVGRFCLWLDGGQAANPFWEEWMLDPYRRLSGQLVFYDNQGQRRRTVAFLDACCIHHDTSLDTRGQDTESALQVEVHLSPAAVHIDGALLEAHSILPWDADRATRERALTKPSDPLPSPALRAKVGSVAALSSLIARPLLKNDADPVHDLLGPGRLSHPEEWAATLNELRNEKVEIIHRKGAMAYGPSPASGKPGQLLLDEDASIGALRHEARHFTDDKALGFPGAIRYYQEPLLRWQTEYNAYMEEVKLTRQIREFAVGKCLVDNARNEKKYLIENFGLKS